MDSEKILFVDDEPNVLDAIKRQLRNKFNFECAVGPMAALETLERDRSFSIIVSDMRMPELDGVGLLKKISEILPSSIHILLTGNADQESAVRAINEGKIFRWLAKPCETEEIQETLTSAIQQHRLQKAEREILHNTLGGCIRLLSELQSSSDPDTSKTSLYSRELTREVAKLLNLSNSWELELAVSLSDIGLKLLPVESQIKLQNGAKLNDKERELIRTTPSIGADLVRNIPRLEGVAEAIRYHQKNYDGSGYPSGVIAGEDIPFSGRVLKIIKALSSLSGGMTVKNLEELLSRPHQYDKAILLRLINSLKPGESQASAGTTSVTVKVKQLTVGQRLTSDLLLNDGRVLLRKDSVLTDATVQKLRNYHSLYGLQEPINVDCVIPSMSIEI